MSYSSLLIFLFQLFRGFVVAYLFPNCTSLSPAVFRTSYVSTLWPFAFTTIARGSLPQHTQIPWFTPLTPPFPFPRSTYTPATFPTHTITAFTTQFSPFPSQAHIPLHLFPLSSLPRRPPIPYIYRTEITLLAPSLSPAENAGNSWKRVFTWGEWRWLCKQGTLESQCPW